MTKAEALYGFWSSFGLPVYEEGSVPEDAVLPYITYPLMLGDWGQEIPITADLWYRTTTLLGINDKTNEIARRIGLGGVKLSCSGGHIHLYCGSPWAQLMGDPDDDMIRRMHLNITARFNTLPQKE